MSQITYPVTFDGVDLNIVPGLTVLSTDPYKPAKRSLNSALIAHSDRSRLMSAYYTERNITVRVGITRTTRRLLEQSVDSLMNIIQGREKELVIPQSTGLRTYTSTFADAVTDKDGGSYLEFELIFSCSDRFGYDIASTLLLQITNYTSSNRSDRLEFGGSAEWQAPVITFTYSVITDGTTKTVTVGNSNTGQEVNITRTWAAGDVVEIDSKNKTVKVNGIEVAFTGAIPEWNTGFGYWYYQDNFSTRTFSGQIRHTRRFV